jgi:hypothetical protein
MLKETLLHVVAFDPEGSPRIAPASFGEDFHKVAPLGN